MSTPPRLLIRCGLIVTMDPARRIIRGGGIIVNGSLIESVLNAEEVAALRPFDGDTMDAGALTLIPGFIQTHIHLCQTIFRGMADDLELLEWLALKIYPFEAAHTAASMRASAMMGIGELVRSGTTTIMDMGSVEFEEEIAAAVEETGLRAFIGKAMMDVNDVYPGLREPTATAIRTTLLQAEAWHGKAGGRLQYAVAPRFVLSCTDPLLTEAHAMTRSFPGMLFHTHAAENRRETEAVRKRCGMSNVEFFESIGILRSNTCLAHCVWLTDKEIGLVKERGAKVLHCPSSNLKLGSGIANVPELLRRGIAVSLGADGAPCNNTLDMFTEMRLAALIQRPRYGPAVMNAQTVFELATLGGARTLGLQRIAGSIEPGKKADVVLLDLNRVWNPAPEEDVYSTIVYSGTPENVRSVMIDGAWIYREGVTTMMDEPHVVETARRELRLLMNRL